MMLIAVLASAINACRPVVYKVMVLTQDIDQVTGLAMYYIYYQGLLLFSPEAVF